MARTIAALEAILADVREKVDAEPDEFVLKQDDSSTAHIEVHMDRNVVSDAVHFGDLLYQLFCSDFAYRHEIEVVEGGIRVVVFLE